METSETGPPGPVAESLNPPVPTISVVVPAYNEARRIGPSIESILRFLKGHDRTAEVILVDDGSDDETRDIAGYEFSSVIPVGGQLKIHLLL